MPFKPIEVLQKVESLLSFNFFRSSPMISGEHMFCLKTWNHAVWCSRCNLSHVSVNCESSPLSAEISWTISCAWSPTSCLHPADLPPPASSIVFSLHLNAACSAVGWATLQAVFRAAERTGAPLCSELDEEETLLGCNEFSSSPCISAKLLGPAQSRRRRRAGGGGGWLTGEEEGEISVLHHCSTRKEEDFCKEWEHH